MKPISYNRFRSLAKISSALSVAFFIHFAASSASAANRFWSANGTTASGNGTWNTSTVNRWGTVAAGPYTLAWVNGVDVAILGSAAASTLTLGENITCGGITAQANNSGSGNINESTNLYTLTLGITGNNVFSGFQSTTAGRPLNINAVIVGTSGANVVLTGPSSTPTQVAAMSLNRANTYVGTTSFSGNSGGAVNLTLGNQLALQNSTLTLSAACKTLIFNDTVTANAFTFGGLAAATAGPGRDLALQNDATSPAAIVLSVGNNDASTSYAAVLSGAGSLVKIGTGTLSLSGNNTYTGTTTVNEGELHGVVGGDCASSKVIIDNALATLGVSVTDNTKTWTCKELAPTAAGEIEFDFGAVTPSTTVSPLTITVPVALTGLADFTAATPKIRISSTVGFPQGTYPLMTWDAVSGTIPTTADLILPTLLPQTAGTLEVSGNTLNLVISSTALSVVKANNPDNLNLGTSWIGGTAPDGTKLAIWNNTVTTANTTVLAADATWAGISILNPNGLVTINGSNTLTLGNAIIDIDLSSANTADLTLNCPLALGADNLWDVAATRTATLGGQISGAFPITKQGAGTATLSSASNNYSGATTVAAGTLKLGAGNVIPDGIGNGNISVAGTLDLNGNSETINGLSGAGMIDNTAIASSTLTVGGNNQTSTFSGVIQDTSGTLNLNKIGSGTLALGSANTLSGAVTISGGVLSANNIAPLDNVTGISMADETRLRTNANNAIINAPITLGALGTTAAINASTFDGTGSTLVPFTIGGAISGAGNLTLSGIEPTNSYGLIILNAASNYTGSTLITCSDEIATPSQVGNNNIFVRLGTPNALPTTTVLTLDGGDGAPLASAPGRFCELNLNGNNQSLAGLTNVTGRPLRVQRVCDRRAGVSSMLTINNATDFEYTGFLGSSSTAGFSNFGVTKDGAGKQTFSGTIGYSGDTIVNQGILSLGVLNQGTVNNNASTVTIANSGASLNLTFVGSDTVDKLFIGAIQQVAGVYGRVGSGAQFEISQITGDGTLTVSSSPGFSSWIAGTFANGTIPLDKRGANDDYDNDGISNLVEYAVAGEDPTVSKAAIGSFNGTLLSFSKRLDASGLTYAIQDSTDLGVSDMWATVTGGSYVNNTTTISYTLTPGSPVRNFVRLQVLSN